MELAVSGASSRGLEVSAVDVESPAKRKAIRAAAPVPSVTELLGKYGPPSIRGISEYDVKDAFDSMDCDGVRGWNF